MSIKIQNNNEIKKSNNQTNTSILYYIILIILYNIINLKTRIINTKMIYIINKIFNTNKKIVINYYKRIKITINDIINKINLIIKLNNRKQKNKELINNNKINKRNKIIINKIINIKIYILYYLIISLIKIKSYYEINLTIKGNGTQQIIYNNQTNNYCGNNKNIIDKPNEIYVNNILYNDTDDYYSVNNLKE